MVSGKPLTSSESEFAPCYSETRPIHMDHLTADGVRVCHHVAVAVKEFTLNRCPSQPSIDGQMMTPDREILLRSDVPSTIP